MSAVAWPEPVDPWRRAFELAWEAFHAGSIPVGAAVASAAGDVVATGRSRAFEREAPHGHVANSYLAHAELNALLQLPPGDYRDHVAYSTLEPCLLCTAALAHAHVGRVRFAARDALWSGIDRLPELNDHVRRRWSAREHALEGPLEQWAELLLLVSHLQRGSDLTQYRVDPTLRNLRLAQQLASSRELQRLEAVDLLDVINRYRESLGSPGGRSSRSVRTRPARSARERT